MELQIKTVDDLQNEIARLTVLKQVQKVAIGARFSSPSAVLSTALSIFPSSSAPTAGSSGGIFNLDIVSVLSRILLPFTLNKTLFRKSNFIVKALVGFISQRASGYINEESVGGIWGKAKSLFSSVTGKKTAPKKRIKGYLPPM